MTRTGNLNREEDFADTVAILAFQGDLNALVGSYSELNLETDLLLRSEVIDRYILLNRNATK